MAKEKKNALEFEVLGLKAKYFVPIAIVILIATYGGFLPTTTLVDEKGVTLTCTTFVGTCAYLWAIGGFCFWLGGVIPIVGKYMGGSALLPLFGGAILKYFNLIPEELYQGVRVLMRGGFQDMYIAFILVGSILVMDRNILLQSTARFMPTILGAQFAAMGVAYLVGNLTGYGGKEALFYIAAPTMSGGSAGAMTTIPKLYSDLSGQDMMWMSGPFLGYVSISNVLAVLVASIVGPLTEKKKSFNGNGKLLAIEGKEYEIKEEKRPGSHLDYKRLAGGMLMSLTFYLAGDIFGKLPGLEIIPGLAWTIILAIIVKATNIVSDQVADYSVYAMNFAIRGLLPMLICGIGINSMDLQVMKDAFTLSAFIVIVATVIACFLGSALIGKLCGLYPYEAGVSSGLCCCNVGGSGDIAILTGANRMNLLAFASIATRIGGALMVIWVGLFYRQLMI